MTVAPPSEIARQHAEKRLGALATPPGRWAVWVSWASGSRPVRGRSRRPRSRTRDW